MAVLALCYGLLAVSFAVSGSRVVPASLGGSSRWLLGVFAPLANEPLSRSALVGPVFFAGLWLCLLLYAALCLRSRDLSLHAALAFIAALHVLFWLAPPLLSQDVFSYIAYANIGAGHGLNPYTTPPLAISHDPAYALAGFKWAPTVYGPLFTLATYPLAAIGLKASFFTLKAVAMLCSLAIVAIVVDLCKRLGRDPVRGAVIAGANPIVLIHGVAAAHNETVIVLFVTASLLCFVRLLPAPSGALAAAAAAMKITLAPVAWFLAVSYVQRNNQASSPPSERLAKPAKLILGAGGVATVAAVVATLCFGYHWLDALTALGSNQARTSHLSLPGASSSALSAIFSHKASYYHPATRLVCACAWVASCAWLLWRTWRGHDPFASAGWAMLLLLCATAWLVPWYLLWALPLVAVAQSRRLVLASLVVAAWTLAIAIPF